MSTFWIILLIAAAAFYALKKFLEQTEAEMEMEEIMESPFSKLKVYYTDRNFRAYELTEKGLEEIDVLMTDIARQLPQLTFSTKSRTRDFRLLGGQHHGTEAWQLIFGKCKPEDNNQYDKNAVAVYSTVGKLMGYLSRDDAARYREEFGDAPHWCWGFTYQTSKGNVAAKLTCLGELFDSPKGQKTPIVDLVRNGLISDYGEMSYFKDHQHRNEE